MKRGLFIIYTGNGKGKTTASLGLAVRTMGHGERICIIQFIKSGLQCGEHKIENILGELYTIHVMGKGFVFKEFQKLSPEDQEMNRKAAKQGWELAKKTISSGEYRLVILDELTYLIQLGLISSDEVLSIIQNRPEKIHVVITGRNAPEKLIKHADIATEMKELKHAFHQGIKAQKCIEW